MRFTPRERARDRRKISIKKANKKLNDASASKTKQCEAKEKHFGVQLCLSFGKYLSAYQAVSIDFVGRILIFDQAHIDFY